MEYVAGRADHRATANRHRLTIAERLELFMQVCDGVQHAHQKAIIHRDLKPSNILVSTQRRKGRSRRSSTSASPRRPAHALTEKTLFTELGAVVGTPGVHEPGAGGASGQDVDTRTDVYSLGVVLYQLLTGTCLSRSKTLRWLQPGGAPPEAEGGRAAPAEHQAEHAGRRGGSGGDEPEDRAGRARRQIQGNSTPSP